jgi:hypothetical protein
METIKKWIDSGLLDGLTEMDKNSRVGKFFEPNLTQKVPNDDENIKISKQK